MKKLLEDAECFYRPKLRLSGHDISRRFASDNGGAIPSNLREKIPNSDREIRQIRERIKPRDIKADSPITWTEWCLHSVSFSRGSRGSRLIGFRSSPGNPRTSNCKVRSPNLRQLDTRNSSFGLRPSRRLAASAFRFVDELPTEELATLWSRLHSDALPVSLNQQQRELVLMGDRATFSIRRN